MAEYRIASRRQTDMAILGVPVHRVGSGDVLAFMRQVITRDEKAIVLNLNAHCLNLATKYSWLHRLLGEAQLVHCDGDGVRLGLKILGHHPPPKVSYNVWFWEICEFCQLHGYSMYLLGAADGVAGEAARKAQARFPGLRIAGTHHGYFPKTGLGNQAVIESINATRPDLLLTCFGMPEQERWIGNNWLKLRVHVFLSGGAALDYAAGRIPCAPSWMVRTHLEWFYRFLLEPRRLAGRYLLGNPLFLARVVHERLSSRRLGGGPPRPVDSIPSRHHASRTTLPSPD